MDIYIAFSSELSGTYNTAIMIERPSKRNKSRMNLVIIDSKCASLGYGLLVKEAVRLRNSRRRCPDQSSEKSALWQTVWSIYSQWKILIIGKWRPRIKNKCIHRRSVEY